MGYYFQKKVVYYKYSIKHKNKLRKEGIYYGSSTFNRGKF
ncbi:hypothetical protein IMSAGC011_00409 [Lachnospiraceae bacterium]|nr:hypothetical protein IMSAGC011_00409 [Lachnospiraceae bacterium]